MDWHPVSDLPVQIGVAPGTLGLAIATASDEKFTSIAETRQRKTQAPLLQSITAKRAKDGEIFAEGRGLY